MRAIDKVMAALTSPVRRDILGLIWERELPAGDTPERSLSTSAVRPMVVATVDVGTDQATTFTAFTDPAVSSRWLDVPVRIDDGEFAATMEWGTEVRGRYELLAPPELIVMRWDFEDDNVPLPGRPLTAYLWV